MSEFWNRVCKNARLLKESQTQNNEDEFIASKTGGVGSQSNLKQDVSANSSADVDINKILSRIDPDVVYSALQYELGRQNKKDKFDAKRIVVQNLMKDPSYYNNPSTFMDGEQDEKELVPPSQKLGSADQPSQEEFHEGFDPQSNAGPNVDATEGQSVYDPYSEWNMKMKQMESDEL